jgi:hypothetical protein
MRAFLALILLIVIVSSVAVAQSRPAAPATTAQPSTGQSPAQAQVMPGPDPTNWPTRVYSIRYVDYRYLLNLLNPIGVQVAGEPNLNAISVRGPEKTLVAVDDIIKRFDVPGNAPKNVDLTVYVVLGSSEGEENVPAALRSVIDQLRGVMTYKTYRVLDTIIARGTEGSSIQTSGAMSKLAETDRSQATYDFRVTARVAGEGADETIHLDNLRFTTQVFPSDTALGPQQTLNIGTSLDVKKGQQVVVGKATMRDRAVILVLSGKVVN